MGLPYSKLIFARTFCMAGKPEVESCRAMIAVNDACGHADTGALAYFLQRVKVDVHGIVNFSKLSN